MNNPPSPQKVDLATAAPLDHENPPQGSSKALIPTKSTTKDGSTPPALDVEQVAKVIRTKHSKDTKKPSTSENDRVSTKDSPKTTGPRQGNDQSTAPTQTRDVSSRAVKNPPPTTTELDLQSDELNRIDQIQIPHLQGPSKSYSIAELQKNQQGWNDHGTLSPTSETSTSMETTSAIPSPMNAKAPTIASNIMPSILHPRNSRLSTKRIQQRTSRTRPISTGPTTNEALKSQARTSIPTTNDAHGVEPPVIASTPSSIGPKTGPQAPVKEQRRTRSTMGYQEEAGAPGMTPNQGDVQAHDIAHLKVNYVQLQARLTKMDQSNAQVMGLLQQLIIQGQQHREHQQQRSEGPAVKMKEEELPPGQQVIRPSGQPQAKRRIELTSRPLQERSKTLGSEKLGLNVRLSLLKSLPNFGLVHVCPCF